MATWSVKMNQYASESEFNEEDVIVSGGQMICFTETSEKASGIF